MCSLGQFSSAPHSSKSAQGPVMFPPPPRKGPTRTQTSSSPDLRQLHIPHWREQGKYEPFPGTTAVAAGPHAMSCHIVVVAVKVEAGMVAFCAVTDAQHLQAEENWPTLGQWLAAKVGTDVGTLELLTPQWAVVLRIGDCEGATFCKSVVYR